MELLYILNLTFAFFIQFSSLIWSKLFFRQRVNPISISFFFIIPVQLFIILIGPIFLLDDVYNVGYQLAVFISNIQSLINIIIIYFVAKFLRVDNSFFNNITNSKYRSKDISLSSIYFFCLALVLFLWIAYISGGIVDWILDPRNSYINKRSGNGVLYSFSVAFFLISFFLAIINDKLNWIFYIKVILYAAFAFLYGSKGIFFNMLICLCV